MKIKKNVCLIIEVPNSEYCFDGKYCCEYFDNEGGHGKCDLNIGTIKYNNETGLYSKPKECLKLYDIIRNKC